VQYQVGRVLRKAFDYIYYYIFPGVNIIFFLINRLTHAHGGGNSNTSSSATAMILVNGYAPGMGFGKNPGILIENYSQ